MNRSGVTAPGGLLDKSRFWASSGHLAGCLVGICLILLGCIWSKLDVQVVVCVKVGDPIFETHGR